MINLFSPVIAIPRRSALYVKCELAVPHEYSRDGELILCSPSEVSAKQWKSQTALTSLKKQRVGNDGSNDLAERSDGQGNGGSMEPALYDDLCYSCYTTFATLSNDKKKEVGRSEVGRSESPLPPWVSRDSRMETSRREMRNEISDYLLDDPDEMH